MSTGRPVLGVALATLLLAGAYGADTLLEGPSRHRVFTEAERAARDASVRARDALSVQAESISVLAQNAMVNTPLVAALRARVDRRTLGDLFASESWWTAYRALGVAVSYKDTTIAFAEPGTRGLPLDALVGRVRASGQLVSATLSGEVRAFLAAAVPIRLSASLPAAVLVLTRPIDEEILKGLADRAQGTVLVIDGKRSLGRVGEDVDLLETALRSERHQPAVGRDPAWAAAEVPLGSGVSLWVGARVTAFARAEASAEQTRRMALWVVALVLASASLVVTLRRPRRGLRSGERLRSGGMPLSPRPRLARSPAVTKGIALGRYLLVERIGEGGMAEVFTAVSFGAEGFRRSFVVKRLRPEMAANANAVAHFIEEANNVSKLVHPNIVPVFDFGEVAGAFFIAEEHIVGRDLGRLNRRLLEERRPGLSVSAALYVTHEILSGLMYVHEARQGHDAPLGFVHRDVSPQNVMLSRLGEVKILDFGIMKATHSASRTEIGTVKGNVDFMSPEQARGRNVDLRSDLFSVGLVLYASVARAPLYRGETLYDRLNHAASGPGPDELARIQALPHPIPELLTRALMRDPAGRFQTAAEFRAAVAGHITGGENEVAALVNELFGQDLQAEVDRLSSVSPPPRVDEQPDRKSG
jgi:serine/threonine protein kinase